TIEKIERGEIGRPATPRRIPVAVARAIRAGLAAAPAERGTFAELIRALDPTPRRWPWLVAGGVALVAATFALARSRAPDCTTMPLAWDPAHVKNAELAARLHGYAERWAKLRHDACVAGALPPERVACFDACRASFETIVASFGDPTVDPAGAWKRVAALPPAEACRGDEAIRLPPRG